MTTLYTNGDFISLSPTAFNSYSAILYSESQPDSSVKLGFTVSGSVDFSTRLGSVSAVVEGFTGNDSIVMGDGNDTVWGNSGSDVLSGGNGNDILFGDWDTSDRSGNDTLYGGDGNDDLIGGPGTDAQYGGRGADVFYVTEAGGSFEGIFGGSGDDAVSIRALFSVNLPTMSISRLAFTEANSIEYLLWDSPEIALLGTSGGDLFDLRNLTTLRWNGLSYEQRFEVNLLNGRDTFTGGAGEEHVTVTGADDRIALGAGNDTLTLADGVLTGSSFSAGAGYDTLELGSQAGVDLPVRSFLVPVLEPAVAMGFERIIIGVDVQLNGTAGADVFDFSAFDLNMRNSGLPVLLLEGNDKVSGATGDFFADGGIGDDTVSSGSGNDRLWGGDGNDALFGGAGNDYLIGGVGADSLVGGEGDDFYGVDSKHDVVVETGSGGIDAVGSGLAVYHLPTGVEDYYVGRAFGAKAFGNAGANHLHDGTGKDLLYGLAGNDTLTSFENRDTLVGGKGNDIYEVWNSTPVKIIELSGEGSDTVRTYLSSYTLPAFVENAEAIHFQKAQMITGNSLGNYITGNAGRDHFVGLEGDDTLDGGAGNDILSGGVGLDVYIVDSSHDRIFDSDGNGYVRSTADSYTLSSGIKWLELLGPAQNGIGNKVANVIIATDDSCRLYGGGGADDLRGGAGNDYLGGGAGKDTMTGGGGVDYFDGGAGDDLFVVNSISDRVFENADEGIDTIITTAAYFVLPDNVENLEDTYSGGTVNSAGAEVYGSGWSTYWSSHEVNDRITTGIGRDSLFGVGGDDTLTGGLGDDLFGVEISSFYASFTTITDFVVGSDKIAIYSGYFGTVAKVSISDLSADMFKVLGKGQTVDADDRFLYRPETGVLWFDADGSGSFAAMKIALIEGHPVLTAADFLMIV